MTDFLKNKEAFREALKTPLGRTRIAMQMRSLIHSRIPRPSSRNLDASLEVFGTMLLIHQWVEQKGEA